MHTIRIGGFFSGIGAHHSAIDRIAASRHDLSFKVVFQCEIDEKTATAYDLMHGEVLNLKDITQVNDIGGNLAVDVLFWTPPCQDISLANNNRQGNKSGSGTRSSLAFEVPRILANTPAEERPRYLVFEEVPMMVSNEYISNFKQIIRALSALGYTSNYGVMNASDYGVAQNRQRCFMVSKLNGAAPTGNKNLKEGHYAPVFLVIAFGDDESGHNQQTHDQDDDGDRVQERFVRGYGVVDGGNDSGGCYESKRIPNGIRNNRSVGNPITIYGIIYYIGQIQNL